MSSLDIPNYLLTKSEVYMAKIFQTGALQYLLIKQ